MGSRGQDCRILSFIELSDQAKCCAPNGPAKAILYDCHTYLKAVQAIAAQQQQSSTRPSRERQAVGLRQRKSLPVEHQAYTVMKHRRTEWSFQ